MMKTNGTAVLFALFLGIFTVGCGEDQPVQTTTIVSSSKVAVAISASDDYISAGDFTTITWNSSNATSCTVAPHYWTGLSGQRSTGALYATTVYSIECGNGSDKISTSITVTVASGGTSSSGGSSGGTTSGGTSSSGGSSGGTTSGGTSSSGGSSGGSTMYACNANGACVPSANGAYASSTCNNMCALPPTMYACNANGACVPSANGAYASSTCNNTCGGPANPNP